MRDIFVVRVKRKRLFFFSVSRYRKYVSLKISAVHVFNLVVNCLPPSIQHQNVSHVATLRPFRGLRARGREEDPPGGAPGPFLRRSPCVPKAAAEAVPKAYLTSTSSAERARRWARKGSEPRGFRTLSIWWIYPKSMEKRENDFKLCFLTFRKFCRIDQRS